MSTTDEGSSHPSDGAVEVAPPPPARPTAAVALWIAAVTVGLIAAGGLLFWRARSRVNDVALSSSARPVTVVEARADTFRAKRRYVATVDPWMQAEVGPQFIAAYADTVLVRPGATVRRGQVLATLDCRGANATQRAVSMQARAIDTRQKALASEAARISSMLDGGFVAKNEVEQKLAGSESELAELMSTQAKLTGTSLAVDDCVLRAPFDGEVSSRAIDPGAFVRPGNRVVSVVDRSTVRVTAEVPESDFAFVAVGTPVKIHMLATGLQTSGPVARRSPAANDSTRTIHFEIDLADPEREFPVGTTAELVVEIGAPEAVTAIPATAAAVHGDDAALFVVDGDRAKKVTAHVRGEEPGTLFLDATLKPGTRVVSEGRSLLDDGDRVLARPAAAPSPSSASAGRQAP